MALSLSYNGVDLSGSSYGVTVVRGPIQIAGPSVLYGANMPSRHGGWSAGTGFYQPRTIECTLHVLGTSWSNLKTKLDNIAWAMRPELGNVPIIFDEASDRRWVGMFTGNVAETPIGNGAIQFNAQFSVPSGLSEAASATTQSVTIDASPKTFNVPASGSVAGTTHALPVWKFRNTHASTITTFTLANTTTAETITVNYSIPQNAYVKVDTEQELISYSTDDVTYTVIMSARSNTNKTFPRLVPASANACSVTGFTAGTLALTYRARYLR
jgi:hypothetical protein